MKDGCSADAEAERVFLHVLTVGSIQRVTVKPFFKSTGKVFGACAVCLEIWLSWCQDQLSSSNQLAMPNLSRHAQYATDTAAGNCIKRVGELNKLKHSAISFLPISCP